MARGYADQGPADSPTPPPPAGLAAGDRALAHGELLRLVEDALDHLYDPVYLQTHPLARLLHQRGRLKGPGLGHALRREMLEAIDALFPGDAAADSPMPRGCRILSLRYVDALTITEVQKQLSIGRSQYYREHRRALAALVSLLRERWQVDDPAISQRGVALPIDDSPSLAPPEPSAVLPMALTSFIGREREMAEVRRLLGTTRLLTLTGSGGCGKTRLALQTAAGLAHKYPDGVQVVELASLSDPGLVPQTVALSLGVGEERDRPVTATLVDFLRPKRVLLLLDNCEHLIHTCSALAELLLRGCPRLQILVTSREALGLGGETRWRVPSLDTPSPERWSAEADHIGEYEAVQLFVERARAVQPDFLLAADNARAVAEVCWRLDGIPLAIELAAARARMLSPEQIALRLEDRFRLLTGGGRTALRRHQTLRATIDWSHDLLDPRVRVLFRRLAAFASGWTLEAAEAVCAEPAPESWRQGAADADGIPAGQVLDLLGQLVDKSLVQVEKGPGELRYRLLETIRQYAQERLLDAGEATKVREAHRDWYVAFAERELPNSVGREQRRCLPRLAAEQANFRAALAWSRRDPEGAEAQLRLAGALGRYWRWIGRWMEAAAWLDEALARCGPLVSTARARALTTWATIEMLYGGDSDRTLVLAEEAVAVARVVDDLPLLAHALRQAALVYCSRGDTQSALGRFDEAVTVAGQADDEREACTALYQRALLCYDPRDLGGIAHGMEQALSAARGLGDGVLLAENLTTLGGVLVTARDYTRAKTVLAEALAWAREANYVEFLSWAAILLGDIALLGGDQGGALKRYAEALARELDRGSEGLAVEVLVRVATLGGEGDEREAAARLFAWCEVRQPRHAAMWMHWMFDRLGASEIAAVHERALATAREALGEEAFARAWEAGRAMMPEEAGELGKSVLQALGASPPPC